MKLAIVFGLAVGLLGLTMGVRASDVRVGPLEPLERELTSIHCSTYIQLKVGIFYLQFYNLYLQLYILTELGLHVCLFMHVSPMTEYKSNKTIRIMQCGLNLCVLQL